MSEKLETEMVEDTPRHRTNSEITHVNTTNSPEKELEIAQSQLH